RGLRRPAGAPEGEIRRDVADRAEHGPREPTPERDAQLRLRGPHHRVAEAALPVAPEEARAPELREQRERRVPVGRLDHGGQPEDATAAERVEAPEVDGALAEPGVAPERLGEADVV